ncbi:translation initiation factor IF-6 [Methanomassiliicoccus luminyensis]|uniref:translation initiation factor IF-6 n=1 Tax=Methanomassiliicoccus luminyensis TaxID=1080712 RepID=UPI000374FB15|nr:translation initiation factor IF-6 [Methanomassiliicoccus luminyensis]
MLKLSSYDGNPFIGVYCVANESYALAPLDAPEALIDDITEGLGVEVLRASLASSSILGTLVAMNSHGAITSGMVALSEIRPLRTKMTVKRIKDRLNACGNNILVNDNAALVNPDLERTAVKQIKDALGVEVVQGMVAGHKTVGSVCVATNKGVLCHPSTSKAEMEMLRSLFKVPVAIGTLNYGAPVVGACMIANSKGAAVGFRSTPIELGRVEDALNI